MPTPVVPTKLKFDIRLVDVHGEPLAGVACDVDSEKETLVSGLRTDSNGVLHLVVPATKLLFLSVPIGGEVLTLRLDVRTYGGGETVDGARARMNNLGYLAMADGDAVDAPPDDAFRRALDRFRYANRLVNGDDFPDGKADAPFDDKTKARLEEAHDGPSGRLLETP